MKLIQALRRKSENDAEYFEPSTERPKNEMPGKHFPSPFLNRKCVRMIPAHAAAARSTRNAVDESHNEAQARVPSLASVPEGSSKLILSVTVVVLRHIAPCSD